MVRNLLIIASLLLALSAGASESSSVIVRDFVPVQGICRAGRAATIGAVVENKGDAAVNLQVRLVVPDGIKLLGKSAESRVNLGAGELRHLYWSIKAADARDYRMQVVVSSGSKQINSSSLSLSFLQPMPIKKLDYIPDPEPVQTSILIGAHNCPLWESDKQQLWNQVRKHPERTPALGFYSQENPEVADWETKWAVEHGISFFIYCWYRTSQGGPVTTMLSSAIHDSLYKSRFKSHMKFAIMWENQNKDTSGISDEKDLTANLLPYWINNCFKDPSYLKIDNKPVLFIYCPQNLIYDLGSIENAANAINLMRKACMDAGFAGLYVLGEYRGLDAGHLQLMKQLGLDYTFAYCWSVPGSPTPEQAIKTQIDDIKQTQALGILPEVVTVSQAWSGWADEGSIWKIPPTQYEDLLKQAKSFISTIPSDQLGSKMLILDNWNEWSEGHYIAPYREYGFGYLDAVRKVFSNAPSRHTDLIPEDIGLGPYDKAYTSYVKNLEDLNQLRVKTARKKGSDEPGLVGWWAFDEATDSPVALDYSGHHLGGTLVKTTRVKGINGSALDCRGGCVLIPSNPRLSPSSAMTLECWVRTDLAGQDNKWMINRVYGGKTNTGYRLGLREGRPCFEIPQTEWSHSLTVSNVLPLGKWIHLAATYDGHMMRIYMDGRECGALPRTGPVNSNDFDLCIGSFAMSHSAYFTGSIDEVKLYNRALSADELAQ